MQIFFCCKLMFYLANISIFSEHKNPRKAGFCASRSSTQPAGAAATSKSVFIQFSQKQSLRFLAIKKCKLGFLLWKSNNRFRFFRFFFIFLSFFDPFFVQKNPCCFLSHWKGWLTAAGKTPDFVISRSNKNTSDRQVSSPNDWGFDWLSLLHLFVITFAPFSRGKG